MDENPVYFVHISDTHIGPTRDYALLDCITLPPVEKLVQTINSLPTRPDFVIHTGDVVASPEPASFELAAETFARLNIPIYYVSGNHDVSPGIRKYLSMGPKEDLSDDDGILSYAFEVKGCRFVTLDARGPEEIDPHGILGEDQLETLRREVRAGSRPLVVFIHFPPLRLDARWFDREMLLLNGEEFHRTLIPARNRLRGVFFGHVHRGMQIFKDGILYSSVAATNIQFDAWPPDEDFSLDRDHPPSFNFVTVMDDQTIVKEHTIVRP